MVPRPSTEWEGSIRVESAHVATLTAVPSPAMPMGTERPVSLDGGRWRPLPDKALPSEAAVHTALEDTGGETARGKGRKVGSGAGWRWTQGKKGVGTGRGNHRQKRWEL